MLRQGGIAPVTRVWTMAYLWWGFSSFDYIGKEDLQKTFNEKAPKLLRYRYLCLETATTCMETTTRSFIEMMVKKKKQSFKSWWSCVAELTHSRSPEKTGLDVEGLKIIGNFRKSHSNLHIEKSVPQ